MLIGAHLELGGAVSHRGFVDIVNSQQGVRGWALDLKRPASPVKLELRVGDLLVAECLADLPRDDIANRLGGDVQPGFCFDVSCIDTIAGLAAAGDDDVAVFIAGTDLRLGANATVTVGDLLKQLAELRKPQARNPTADFDLLLDELRGAAGPMSELALRPLPENLQGYIETVSIDPAGQIWFFGWMRKGHLTEFSAVISERRKTPAAVVIMSYQRDDLPPDACGLIGLLSTIWRPTSATGEFHVFFGNQGRYHLKAHTPLRLVTTADFVAEYEHVRERCLGDGRAMALSRMLTSLDSWVPTRGSGQGYATETSIDRVLLAPGLGCLVEGWVISPLKRIEGLRLKIGDAVMSAHPDTLYFKPRPDLKDAFEGSDAMVARAGFVGLFTGETEPEDFADPVLKIVFEGGTSANWPVNPKVFRKLGHSAGIEEGLRFFPSLQEEAFFPRYAQSAIRAQRSSMTPPVALTVKRHRRTLIIALPDDRCDLFLLFETISGICRAQLGSAKPIEAVAFIASNKANRSDALWLFRDFEAEQNIAASLFAIDDSAHAFALLPDILHALGCNRFVFLGHGMFPTASGWADIRHSLHIAGGELAFFALQANSIEQLQADETMTARAFGWATGPFTRWAAQASPYLGGYFRENGLLWASVAHAVHHNAMRPSRTTVSPRIEEAVNAAVYTLGPLEIA
jgi:hypothetical protein